MAPVSPEARMTASSGHRLGCHGAAALCKKFSERFLQNGAYMSNLGRGPAACDGLWCRKSGCSVHRKISSGRLFDRWGTVPTSY